MIKRKYLNNLDLDARKFVVLIITILLFFVLPISVFQQTQGIEPQITTQTEGRVAGVNTENNTDTNNLDTINPEILFLTLGIIFSGISVVLAIYFILVSFRIKNSK